MRNKTAIMSLILIALFGMFCAVRDAVAVDPPHNGQNSLSMSIQCTTCHYDTTLPPPDWATKPTTTDNTYFNNLCTSCHVQGIVDPKYDVKTHSSGQMASGKYPPWTIECRVCHNPHYQDQISSYPTDTTINLFSGTTITSSQALVNAPSSTIFVNAPGLVEDRWIDYMLVPNVAYPTKMYRILSNTNNSFRVIGSINMRYAAHGSTFGVRLSSMLLAQLRTPLGAVETVKFFTADSSRPNSYASSTTSDNVTGICQVCHTQTQSFNRTATRTGGTGSIQEGPSHPAGVVAEGKKCTECHIHTQGFKGECNSCHGYPPESVATLVFRDKVNQPVTSDSGAGPGAHKKHVDSLQMVCANCHANGMLAGASAGDYQINIGFDYLSGTTTGTYDSKATRTVYPLVGSVTYFNTYQCSNIYCHSSGQGSTSRNPTPVYATPQWNVPSSGACGTCHQTKAGHALGPISSGSHTTHMNVSGTGCDDCHRGAAADASSYPSTSHVNKLIDVANNYTAGGGVGNGYGYCSATTCHGTQSPVWGENTASATCVKCHGVPGTTTAAYNANKDLAAPGYNGLGVNTARTVGTITSNVSQDPKVGAHDAHLQGLGGYKTGGIACTDCHAVSSLTDSGHMNGSTTFVWSSLATMSGALTPNYSGGVCSNVYCHGAGMKYSADQGSDITPQWNDGAYLTSNATTMNDTDCNRCHLSPAINSSYNHQGLFLLPNACTSCHGHDGAGATHIDGILQAQGGACDACHSYDVDANGDWGHSPRAMEGWGAHATHIRHLKAVNGVSLNAATNAFAGPEYGKVCGVCHTMTNNSLVHSMSGVTNVRQITFGDGSLAHQFAVSAGSPTYQGVTGQPSSSYAKVCSNISCHFQQSPVWEGY